MSTTTPVTVADRLRGVVELLRPANVVTAWADVLAGAACALGFSVWTASTGDLAALLVATSGLYAGGVVLNDVFDAALDAAERPERPIPSGRVPRPAAAVLGAGLLAGGVAAAATVSTLAATVALAIAALAAVYDAWGKHRPWLGPINMGTCRAGNLLLGTTLVPAAIGALWPLGALPVVYVAAITVMSRGEVHGASRTPLVAAVALAALVTGGVAALGWLGWSFSVLTALPFLALFAAWVGRPFVTAARTGDPGDVRAAVGAGVLALIPLNATLAAGFAGLGAGLAVLALWPLSFALARAFAVT